MTANTQTPAKQEAEGPPPPPKQLKTRNAILMVVIEGHTLREAAKRAGMNESSLSRAMAKPAHKAWADHQMAQYALDADKLKAHAEKRAIQVGVDLMNNGKSEAVRARMVEFFAGRDKKSPAVVINNNLNTGGYEYKPPGARIVDVEQAEDAETVPDQALEHRPTDTPSGGHDT